MHQSIHRRHHLYPPPQDPIHPLPRHHLVGWTGFIGNSAINVYNKIQILTERVLFSNLPS